MILQKSNELTNCTINDDGLAVFKIDNTEDIKYYIDDVSHDGIRNVFKNQLMKKRNSELNIIKDKIDNLQRIFLQNLSNNQGMESMQTKDIPPATLGNGTDKTN
jgi:hypothetical protein